MSMSLLRTKYKQVQLLEQIKNNCPKDLIWLIQSCALGDYKLPCLPISGGNHPNKTENPSIDVPDHSEQARKPRSYASLKLRPTHLLTYSQG